MAADAQAIQELIARINASERVRSSAHFSDMVYRGEPIVRTGRQMASYLPERYRERRASARYRSEDGKGRWLSGAELFYRQARFMEDFEDDCPYHGRFTSYYPTYNDMSDQQLRGYFTWRAAVRRGDVQQTCLSFAYIYLYELICGIGVASPEDGFARMKAFWLAYRPFEPALDRYARTWLHDYVVYHGLDPALLADDPAVAADAALVDLLRASAPFDPALAGLLDLVRADAAPSAPGATRRGRRPALPLPPDQELEDRLIDALAAVSTYRIKSSRLWREHPEDLRHVACAVYVRMLDYYRRNRTRGFIETSFGEEAEMSYTMFGSAVFFEEHRHPDAVYVLDPVRSYRCRKGYWTCRRIYGGRDKSRAFGSLAKAVDARLRERMEFEPRLKEQKVPKYLAKIIDREIDDWLAWKEAHAPRRIEIDLGSLERIRSAAAVTREALLIDEERDDAAVPDGMEAVADPLDRGSTEAPDAPRREGPAPMRPAMHTGASAIGAAPSTRHHPLDEGAPGWTGGAKPPRSAGSVASPGTDPDEPGHVQAAATSAIGPAGGTTAPQAPSLGRATPGAPAAQGGTLSPAEEAFLRALLLGEAPVAPPGTSADMLVDAINEKLFDLVGDTVIEFGPEGPRLIEDYADDIREVISA